METIEKGQWAHHRIFKKGKKEKKKKKNTTK